jgi:hypothetical protein
MFFWTLQITIISIILIFLVHNLIGFFKSTLTVPKIKDLVNAPAQKYENIFNALAKSSNISVEDSLSLSLSFDEPKPNIKSMKNELKDFLKNKLKGNDNQNTTAISSLDSSGIESMNSLSYSAY